MNTDNLKTLIGFIDNEVVQQKLLCSEDRIRRSFTELFSGYTLRGEDILNDVVHVEEYTGIVEMRNIQFYSMCEHHFAPFFGTCDIFYQPDKIITGLGKLVRLAKDVHGRRLQIQELMTRDICQDVMRVLKAKGCFVRTRAKHLCICSRGPSDDVAETICTYAEGTLTKYLFNDK
jgi:GTP cyclohydrolase IA